MQFIRDGGTGGMESTLEGIGSISLVKSTAVTVVLRPYLILAVPSLEMSVVQRSI
jgi:UDP-GlcNAc:undecaprenyl-phosphate GlcNAc-1-phosphate transferase